VLKAPIVWRFNAKGEERPHTAPIIVTIHEMEMGKEGKRKKEKTNQAEWRIQNKL